MLCFLLTSKCRDTAPVVFFGQFEDLLWIFKHVFSQQNHQKVGVPESPKKSRMSNLIAIKRGLQTLQYPGFLWSTFSIIIFQILF